jgi:hypothetical protein
VHALRLTDVEMKKLPTAIYESFTIEDENILRVTKGWEIFIDEPAKAFVFRRVKTDYTAASAYRTQFSERKESGFRSFCYCPAEGNCKTTYENIGNEEHVRCEGNCTCSSFFIFEPDECPPEVMSPNGGWSGFNCWR